METVVASLGAKQHLNALHPPGGGEVPTEALHIRCMPLAALTACLSYLAPVVVVQSHIAETAVPHFEWLPALLSR